MIFFVKRVEWSTRAVQDEHKETGDNGENREGLGSMGGRASWLEEAQTVLSTPAALWEAFHWCVGSEGMGVDGYSLLLPVPLSSEIWALPTNYIRIS